MIFRPSREQRGADPFLTAKVAIFVLGGAIALIGIALDRSWLITVAIGVLLVGFALRFVRRDAADEEPPS